MRNKIFLTSIIAMMVVNAPAFAVDDIMPANMFGVGHTESGSTPYGTAGNDPWNGYIGLIQNTDNVTATANCSADPLRYHNTTPDRGTFTFEAQYSPKNYKVIYKRGSDCGGALDGNVDCDDPANPSTCVGTAVFNENYTIKKVGSGTIANGWSGVSIPDGYIFDHWEGSSTNSAKYYGGSTPVNYMDLSTAINTSDSNADRYYTNQESFIYRIDDDLTLTAKCTKELYYITYDCNCSTYGTDCHSTNPPTDSTGYTVENENVPLATNDDTTQCGVNSRDFTGWDCKKTGDSSVPVPTGGTPQVITGYFPAYNVTCYAQWSEAGSHEISYDCGDVGGTAPSSSHPTYRGAWSLQATPGNGCNSTGYTFTGWDCDNDIDDTASSGTPNYPVNSSGSVVASSNDYNINGDTECTAQWTQNTITLIWDQNGGTGVTQTQTSCMYGDLAGTAGGIGGDTSNGGIGVEQPSKPGYTFKGWKIKTHTN